MKRHRSDIEDILQRLLPSAPKTQMESALDRVHSRLQFGARAELLDVPADFDAAHVSGWRVAKLMAAAALLFAGVWVGMSWQGRTAPGSGLYAVLETEEGSVYRIEEGASVTIRARDRIDARQVVRSNGATGAQLKLADGSRIEMRSQSELSLERADDGARIRLNTGGIIVNAARQRTGHLYVLTKDVTVSVVGTVFLVNAKEEGTGVAVIDGEVRVQEHGGNVRKLLRGEQLVTNPFMKVAPLAIAVAWSRNAEEHLALLRQSIAPPPAVPPQGSTDRPDSFEAIVIRLRATRTSGGGRGEGVFPSGFPPACGATLRIDPRRFLATGITVYELMTIAYEKNCEFSEEYPESAGLTGGPAWIRSERFDIEAVGAGDQLDYTSRSLGSGELQQFAPGPKLRRMLQALLAERFSLMLRHDTKEMPVYELGVAKGGLKLRPSKETEGFTSYVGGGGLYEAIRNDINPKPEYSGLIVGAISARKASMADLSLQLARLTGRPVLDRTGIAGLFTYEFFFAPGQFRAWRRNPNDTRPQLQRPSLFAVVEEELGLRLEAKKGLVEVLAIDRVERPKEN